MRPNTVTLTVQGCWARVSPSGGRCFRGAAGLGRLQAAAAAAEQGAGHTRSQWEPSTYYWAPWQAQGILQRPCNSNGSTQQAPWAQTCHAARPILL